MNLGCPAPSSKRISRAAMFLKPFVLVILGYLLPLERVKVTLTRSLADKSKIYVGRID